MLDISNSAVEAGGIESLLRCWFGDGVVGGVFFGDFSVHYYGEVLPGHADAVVGESILREIIGFDFFVAHAAADLSGSEGGDLILLFFDFGFPEFGAEEFHGDFPVLVLGAFGLGGDDDAGGFVLDADGC